MTCPSCGGELVPGQSRCPVCEASVAPRVEGSLAADPRIVTPPARGKGRASEERVEPLRDIPGLRKREKTWRDEVQERVRSRRQKRASAGLPLFDQPASTPGPPRPPLDAGPTVEARPPAPLPEPKAVPVVAAPAVRVPPAGEPLLSEPDLRSTRLSEAELADLPLQSPPPPVEAAPSRPSPREAPSLDEDLALSEPDAEAEIALPPHRAEPPPLERPARAMERARAAGFDAVILGLLWAVVVYFAGRAARVEVSALSSSWQWLLAYLGLLGLFYAAYFTGTTGQTPGKLLTGLRVVDQAGRPPTYLSAMTRAIVGSLGILGMGLGLLPMAFDPAGRALHDRLLRTRVVRH